MQWNFIFCLLLVSAVLANPRSKRSLGHIKNLFANKLLGSNKVVIAQPVLAKNETHQLFKIPGFNDILIKVCRKEKPIYDKDEGKPAKPKDLIIVKPEVAIVGSYLGTTTQKETLLAIDMVRNLINSGILSDRRDNSIQELVVPFTPQQQNVPLNIYEEGHVFVPMGVQEVVTPVQAKYSYKQKGIDADMTYKSYDGKDVIVTRTEKEPPLPQYIMLRIAEMARTAANPFTIKPQGVNGEPIPFYVNSGQPQIVSGAPFPYYVNPGAMMPEYLQGPEPYVSHGIPQPFGNGPSESVENNRRVFGGPVMVDRNPIFLPEPVPNVGPLPYYVNPGVVPEYIPIPFSTYRIPPQTPRNGAAEHVGNNIYGAPIIVNRNPIVLPEPMPFGSPYHVANNVQVNRCKGTIKICPQENIQLKPSNRPNIVLKFDETKQQNNAYDAKSESNANAHKIAVNKFLKNHTVNGQIVSQYSYKQMNHHSRLNYTEVKTGETPQLEGAGTEKNNKDYEKDYVFLPPKGVIPALRSVLSQKNKPGNGKVTGPQIVSGAPFPYYDSPGVMIPEFVQEPKPYMLPGIPPPLGSYPAEYVGNNRGVFGGPVMVDRNPILSPEPVPNAGPIPLYFNPGAMPKYLQGPYSSPRIPQPYINGGENVRNNISRAPILVDRSPILLPEPMPIGSPYHVVNNMQINRCKGTVKICTQENIQLKDNPRQNIVSTFDKPKEQPTGNKAYENKSESNANAHKIAVNEFLKNYTVNGKIVSQYSYKQMNHDSRQNYTEVKTGETPQLEGTGTEKNNKDSHNDYLFVPPKGVISQIQSALSLKNNPDNGNKVTEPQILSGAPFPYYDIPGVMLPEFVQEPKPYLLPGIPQPLGNGPAEYVGNNRGVYGGPLMVDKNPILLSQPVPNDGPLPYYGNPGVIPEYIPRPFSTQRIPQPPRNGAEYVVNNINGAPILVDRNPILLPEPMPFENPYHVVNNMQVNRCKGTFKLCPQENTHLKDNNRQNIVTKFDKPKRQNNAYDNKSENNANAYKIAVNEFLKNRSVNDQIVSQYSYKQMNHHSRLNDTEVKVNEAPQFEGTGYERIRIDPRKDYAFLPPKGLESSKLSGSLNNKPVDGKIAELNAKNAVFSKIPSNGVIANRKQYVPSLQSYPIVVPEQPNTEIREQYIDDKKTNDVKTIVSFDENSIRGDIPGANF